MKKRNRSHSQYELQTNKWYTSFVIIVFSHLNSWLYAIISDMQKEMYPSVYIVRPGLVIFKYKLIYVLRVDGNW